MQHIQKKLLAFCGYGLLVLLFQHTVFAQKITRVEPANWWVGMQLNEIELLIYGEKIGHLSAAINHPHVALKQTKQVPNQNYLFVTLQISPQAQAGTVQIELKEGSKTVLKQPFALWEREKGRANLQGFTSADVMYMITPDRFVNGDASNDVVAEYLENKIDRKNIGGRHGGDIQGIRQSLDYIKNLGATAIWINPLLENNSKEYSYHGYAITDFYKTDKRYGTNESYRAMVQEAQSKGLKVIADMVTNHIGLEHWWMKDLPTTDWLNQWKNFTETNHRKTVFLDPHATEYDKKVLTDGWFVPSMPDLNQRNTSLANYLIQNTIWWIEYAGINGIRLDTYPYPDKDFMSRWAKAVMTEYPQFNIVGEEWFHLPTITSYWQQGKKNSDGYNSHLKTVMDFPLQEALVKSLNGKKTWTSSWVETYYSLSQDFLYADIHNILIFPDNHDMSRIYTQLNEDFANWKLAMTLYMTMRGIPCVYYGTELLFTNPNTTDHGVIRADFLGGFQGDVANALTGAGLTPQQKEATEYLRKLMQWRQTAPEVHTGKLIHFSPDANDVYVYFRLNEQRKTMIILNKNKESVTLKLEKYREVLGNVQEGKEIINNTSLTLKENLVLAPQTAFIIEIK
jgi:glycosidase